MSDTSTSGQTPAAPAAPAAETPSAPPPATFGSSRGSGLARGKRNSPPAASPAAPATAPTGNYQPTAIQIVAVQTEYKNPFAPVEEAPLPAATAPAPEADSASPAAAAATPISAAVSAEPSPAPAPTAGTTPELFPLDDQTQAAPKPAGSAPEPVKAELNILPPAEVKRPAQSWESTSFKGGDTPRAEPRRERREERPVFKPERREPRPGGEAGAGEPRRESRGFEPKASPAFASRPAPVAEAPAKSGGFLGWLKGLFGGDGGESAPPATAAQPGDERRHEDGGRRRRRRGGRGRHGGFQGGPGGEQRERGPKPGGTEGHPHAHGGEGGGGRRRRRGGRGRHGGGPRHEGGGDHAS